VQIKARFDEKRVESGLRTHDKSVQDDDWRGIFYDMDISVLIENACQKREPLRRVTDALRLVNSNGDQIPGLVVEQYARHWVIHLFRAFSEEAIQSVADYLILRFDPDYLIVKFRFSESGKANTPESVRVMVDKKGSMTTVTEYGVAFEVDLNDTQNSGLFLDMRKTRNLISTLCRDQEVLNCFAYTCSFGVHARVGSAKRVVNLDVSAKILDKGRRNDALNGFSPLEGEFVLTDTLRYLKGAAKRDNRFDVIILDPPTFSRYQGKVFTIVKALPDLIYFSLKILKPGGYLLVSTNCTELTPDRLEAVISSGMELAARTVVSMVRLGQDEDFIGSGTMKESFLSCVLVKLV